jgi:hypothetical protein
MRASYVVIASVVVGGALGMGMSWANFHSSPSLVTPAGAARPTTQSGQRRPKVLVDAPIHDFGAVERDTKATHVFKITNLGNAPLELEAGETTCTRCTITKLEKTHVAPGETADVKVEYLTTQSQPRFRQHATILTNDPEHPTVDLTIVGIVTSRYRVVPDNLVLSKVSANESKTVEIQIYGFVSEEVGLEKYEFTDQKSADHFELTTLPMPRDQLAIPDARSGLRVLVTLKPGLPLGPIRQTIRLELKMPGYATNPVVEVPMEGTVDSDISIAGRGWNADAGRLLIGEVKSGDGAHRDLLLLLRGPHGRDVEIKPVKVEPSWLKVTLGEPTELTSGVSQRTLTIEIPPGTPPANHLGGPQGKSAQVILETTHPLVKQIVLYVQFVVLP